MCSARVFFALFFIVTFSSCNTTTQAPRLKANSIQTILITLVPNDGVLLDKQISFELPKSQVDEILDRISAKSLCDGGASNSSYPIVVVIHIVAAEGSFAVAIRSAGKNPAIVSYDNSTYYWTNYTGNSNGALEFFNFLFDLQSRLEKGK